MASSRIDTLQFPSVAVTSSREDSHLHVSAHAGRTMKRGGPDGPPLPLSIFTEVLRHSVRRERGKAIAAIGGSHQEEEVLPLLHLADLLAECLDRSHGLAVRLEHHVAGVKASLLGRAARLDGSDQNTLSVLKPALGSFLGRKFAEGETPLALARSRLRRGPPHPRALRPSR